MQINRLIILTLIAGSYSAGSPAFEPLTGEFAAEKDCPAVLSIKKGTNPGRVNLRAGRVYKVLGLNSPAGEFVQVSVPDASPAPRWVDKDCGKLSGGEVFNGGGSGTGRTGGKYLLAMSWQPAFCETKPSKTECRSQVADRFDADHFSLHGLWPQPESNVFCGVTKKNQANSNKSRWNSLPEPKLSPETRAALNEVMPGTASNLQRHEYNKHGTCFHGTAEDYFRTSVNLMKQVNQSKLRDWMAQHIGQEVAVSDLQREFAASFGDKAGSAMSVHCIGDVDSRRTLISEIWINLQDPLTESAELADVLDTAAGTSTNCRKAVVDPAGLN